MESSHQARKLIGTLLVWFLLAMVILAATAQFSSDIALALAQKKEEGVRVLVLTQPAMLLSYNTKTQKAAVKVFNVKGKGKTPKERAVKILESENLPLKIKFFEPLQFDREVFWSDFKYLLENWRYNPLITAQTLGGYLTAKHDGRTNLSAAEFILLSMEVSRLETTDFAVKFPASSKRKKKETAWYPPIEKQTGSDSNRERPLVIEVLNASGKKGLALALTQYLREQNNKGLLRVDVLQYDNYPSLQEKSHIVDYSGRLIQVKQLSQAIGISEEIRSDSSSNGMYDSRVILGKDFKLP